MAVDPLAPVARIPLWARQAVYLVALVVLPLSVILGWTDDNTVAQILTALSIMLAPGVALANLAPSARDIERDRKYADPVPVDPDMLADRDHGDYPPDEYRGKHRDGE